MRISSFEQYHKVQSNINRIQMQAAKQQFQIATGVKFQRPSDSPIDSKQLEVVKHSLHKLEQYKRNANDSIGILETVETAMRQAYSVLDTVNQTAIQASNDTYTLSDLQALAKVVDSSISQLVDLGNTKHLGKYVFAGERYTEEPFSFDGTSVTYQGSTNEVDFKISPYITTTVIKGGDYVIEKAINDLISIRDKIMTGDKTGLDTLIAENQKSMDAVSNYQAEAGVDIKALETAKDGFMEQELNLEERRSSIEDVDYARLMVDYSITQRAYEGTLKATAMMFQTSILNYL